MDNLLYGEECYKIQGAIFEIYKQLGCGHKEIVYHQALVHSLISLDFKVETEKKIPVIFNGKKVGSYTPDVIVNEVIMLELKAKPFLTKQDTEQFWHYLTATDYKVGLLINFGKPGKVEIIRRVYDTARSKSNV